MKNVTEISSAQMYLPFELRHLRVAAYCRVSTALEEQNSGIELQERHYTYLISANPNWENVRKKPEFRRMINTCRRKKVDLILTKSISRFGRNTLDMLKALQELQSLGVEVYFEQENL